MENHKQNLFLYTQRLSTGLKINSAADDAANLSLSTKIKTTIDACGTLENNAKTGLNLLNTAEADLNEITEMLQRMRNLSVQGLNEVYSTSEKEALMNEINELGKEIKRITQSSRFGDKNVFEKDLINPLEILVSNSGNSSSIQDSDYINLDHLSDNMLFADVLAKDENVYMLNMTPGAAHYVAFNEKIYLITNNSSETRNFIYGYEENLADEDSSIQFVQDFEDIVATFIAPYENTQTQLGNGEYFMTVNGGSTRHFTSGTGVYTLTNTGATEQTAVFDLGGVISGADTSLAHVFDLSAYNTALGNERAFELEGSEINYINSGGNIYRITNNSAAPETLITRNAVPAIVSGNATVSYAGALATSLNLDNTYSNETLSATQELYYEHGGTYYSIKNNTGTTQSFVINAANTVINPNASVTRSVINPVADTTVSSLTNPVVMDVTAGQRYYIEGTTGVYELTASGTGKLILDFDGTTISNIGGVGAANSFYSTASGGYETLPANPNFTLDFTAGQNKIINIDNEMYKINNTGGVINNVDFTWDSGTHAITEDTPLAQITVSAYQGDLSSITGLGANDFYLSSLNNGTSRYMQFGADIFRISNSSGSATDSILTYNAGAHTITSSEGGISATLINQASFTVDTATENLLSFTAGQTRSVLFGSEMYEIRNNSATAQNLIFTESGGVLTINDPAISANFTVTQGEYNTGTNLNAGDIYRTFTSGESLHISAGGEYFNLNNTAGNRTAVFRQSGTNLTQIQGSTVTDTHIATESNETLSTANDYSIELPAGDDQWIKLNGSTYHLENVSGSIKTNVFHQVGLGLIGENSQITSTYIPIANQDNFNQMLPIVDWAINVVSEKRAEMGCKMATMDQSIERNSIRKMNLMQANSTIIDADIAKEQSNYMRTEILSNFTSTLFKQSKNMNRDIVLSLLQ